jgi:hypothetical protein
MNGLPHGVLLLPSEDDAGMRYVLRHIARIEAIEIRHIKAAEDAVLGRGKGEMVLIRALDHRGFKCGLYIDAARGAP